MTIKKAIKEINYRDFLHLKADTILGKLAVGLVRNFDTYSFPLLLTYGRTRVIEKDGHLTLGLPKGLFEVLKWLDRDSILKCEEMIQMITSQVKGGDDFKRTFITFFMLIYMYYLNYVVVALSILDFEGWINNKIKSKEDMNSKSNLATVILRISWIRIRP
ncbi:hypothetical protein Cgig2_034096 [Carnegiea gigantea]|uniref:Uncharacterized protein n=1 Tax=Carnegiea gigantea TaxID=171969 RepID=A0A9Q1JJU9_9CARY|nr:hypothetical protein Cgig2_034096 [Carnegiea gigantea]